MNNITMRPLRSPSHRDCNEYSLAKDVWVDNSDTTDNDKEKISSWKTWKEEKIYTVQDG
jgi:hypothetical protein